MKELSIEQKAKAYDKAIKVIKDNLYALNEITETGANVINIQSIRNCFYKAFPELKKSENERIRKMIINHLAQERGSLSNEEATEAIAWLEKQDEQKQLYIRFGEIPTNEKSKIYAGEIEVGTENGVSVYPAFKTDEGDIVLGLNLPITKTTLYTQQHLIEYDDRPCYLVTGDYVGKDTDGQTLIKNVSIIEKIDNYRVKEKKQDEQRPIIEMKSPEKSLDISSKKYNEIVNDCLYGEQKTFNEVEPKFHEGEWITNGDYTWKIVEVKPLDYILQSQDGNIVDDAISYVNEQFHSFTVKDAKDGDVLCVKYGNDELPFIFTGKQDNVAYCALNSFGEFVLSIAEWLLTTSVLPATKE